MRCGTIAIKNTNSERIQVIIELAEDGTVWMTKNEIATLFGVYYSSVEANLKFLFKSNTLLEKEVKKEECHILENHQKYMVEYFNLEVIIGLSYRLESYPCTLFRRWVSQQVTNSLKNHSQLIDWLGTTAKMN